MKTRLLIIIMAAFVLGIPQIFSEKNEPVVLTPFDVYLSPDDFTTQGPNHNILILDSGQSTTVNVSVKNNDDIPHKIRLYGPNNSDLRAFSLFKFEPEEIVVLPHKTNSTKLYMTVANQSGIGSTFVTFLGQSDIFGMRGLGFFLVIDDGLNELVDKSLRSGLPGAAFPRIDTDISEDDAEKRIENGFGTPRYIPKSYKFRGMTDWGDTKQFVYSPSPITNSIEATGFWTDGGMMIFYGIDGPNVNNTESLPVRVAQDEGQQVMVNGMMGIAVEQKTQVVVYANTTYKVPADLHFFDDSEKISVSMTANMPLDELLKVAASIPKFALDGDEGKEVLSPLKQFKAGVPIDEIECKDGLFLAGKHDGSPACVKPETIPKLIERGWAKPDQRL